MVKNLLKVLVKVLVEEVRYRPAPLRPAPSHYSAYFQIKALVEFVETTWKPSGTPLDGPTIVRFSKFPLPLPSPLPPNPLDESQEGFHRPLVKPAQVNGVSSSARSLSSIPQWERTH
jgi:hypothetical protein